MPNSPEILTVTQLNTLIKGLLNQSFSNIWLAGEVSGLSRSGSGHVYFSLKDANSTISAVIWRSTSSRLQFNLKDGMAILCRGRVDVYPPSGRYQMIVDYAEPRGEGRLQREYRLLYERLSQEGLFDPARKKRIPTRIQRIGIVTGLSTAALQDFLEVLRRRWKGLNVLIAPAKVQGEGSAREVAAQIYNLNRMKDPVDVIVLARGGGSPEDLWTFNEEIVVRAVAGSRIPTVSAIGHEVDVTLCDFAADLRALTPTEAAERISPDTQTISRQLEQFDNRLKSSLFMRLRMAQQRLESLANRRIFLHPEEMVTFRQQRLDELERRLSGGMEKTIANQERRMERLAGSLENLSPLKVLARGYSVTFDQAQRVVSNAQQVKSGDCITTRLANGTLLSQVLETRDSSP